MRSRAPERKPIVAREWRALPALGRMARVSTRSASSTNLLRCARRGLLWLRREEKTKPKRERRIPLRPPPHNDWRRRLSCRSSCSNSLASLSALASQPRWLPPLLLMLKRRMMQDRVCL